MDHARGDGRLLAVHRLHVAEAEEAVAVARVADRSLDDVARAERMAPDLLLRDEDVFGAGEEVVLRRTQEAVSLADDLQAAARQDRAALREIRADRGEDQLVLPVGTEFLGVGAGHHPLDDDRRRPGLDVREAILRQARIAVRIGRRLGLLRPLLGRQRRIEERIH